MLDDGTLIEDTFKPVDAVLSHPPPPTRAVSLLILREAIVSDVALLPRVSGGYGPGSRSTGGLKMRGYVDLAREPAARSYVSSCNSSLPSIG